jgi:hypothetical protein
VNEQCGACSHPAHWRECQADVTGLLGTTYKCPCRHRGPSGPESEPEWVAADRFEVLEPKMMPGQEQYKPGELQELYALVHDAAEGDPGEAGE